METRLGSLNDRAKALHTAPPAAPRSLPQSRLVGSRWTWRSLLLERALEVLAHLFDGSQTQLAQTVASHEQNPVDNNYRITA